MQGNSQRSRFSSRPVVHTGLEKDFFIDWQIDLKVSGHAAVLNLRVQAPLFLRRSHT